MIALQEQSMAAGQVQGNMGRGVPQIGQDTQAPVAIGAAQLQGFSSIVRHGKRLDLQVIEPDALSILRHSKQTLEFRRAHGAVGAVAHPHRNGFAPHQLGDTADVVPVFVGDEDGIKLAGQQACLGQALVQMLQSQAAVHQQARHPTTTVRFHHRGIAGTATAQVLESEHRFAPEALTSGRPQSAAQCAGRWLRSRVSLWH